MRQFASTPTRALTDDRLTLSAKVLLTALGAFTDRDGYCFPGNKTLCRITTLSERSVRDGLKMLAEYGWVVPVERAHPDGSPASTGYYVRYDAPIPSEGGGANIAPRGAEIAAGPESFSVGAENLSAPIYMNDASNNAGEEGASSPSSMEDALEAALQPYLRTARYEASIRGVITGLTSGMHGPAYGLPVITQALLEMQAANAAFSAAALRGFCRKVVDQQASERARQNVAASHLKLEKPRREPREKRDPSAPLPDFRQIMAETATSMGAGPVVAPARSSREIEAPQPAPRDPRTAEQKREDIRRAAAEERLRKQGGGGS